MMDMELELELDLEKETNERCLGSLTKLLMVMDPSLTTIPIASHLTIAIIFTAKNAPTKISELNKN